MSGTALVQSMFGGDGINVTKEGKIELGAADGSVQNLTNVSFDNIGTEAVADLPIQEDTTLVVMVVITARLLRDAATSVAGSSASYVRIANVSRVGDADPVLTGGGVTSTSTLESSSGTLAADWDVSLTIDTVNDSLQANFIVANNSYAEGTEGNIAISVNFIVLGKVVDVAA